jgi:diketogulonate reductase-like aldo/keto reductase
MSVAAPPRSGAPGIDRKPFGHFARKLPVIGQGTWYIDDAHRPTAIAALRRGLDLGMTHIDTAEMYGDAEAVVGEAIEGRRDEVFLVSKVVPSNASRAGVLAACERSLTRMRTDTRSFSAYRSRPRSGRPFIDAVFASHPTMLQYVSIMPA